jgi:hypothetical protein
MECQNKVSNPTQKNAKSAPLEKPYPDTYPHTRTHKKLLDIYVIHQSYKGNH